MFTGIVEEIGIIRSVIKGEKSAKLVIGAEKILKGVKSGDSIAVNGICLTVTSYTSHYFNVDVMAETMRKTNLEQLQPYSKVNLERALKADSRIGGHFVSGHIDGTGVIKDIKREENAVWVIISASENILKYIINNGSVAVDGISLTAAYADEYIFKVSIIPHTKNMTILLTKKIGEQVNIECDLIGKYIEKLFKHDKKDDKKQNIDMDFLYTNGFV